MKKDKPLVTCVVSIYNLSDCVERCVNSLLAQDYENLQIMLVDDGSTDDSLSVCIKMAEAFDSIRVLSKENGGLSSARNYAVSKIKEGFIVFVDIDDVVAPDYISALVSANNNDKSCISVVGLYQTGNPDAWLASQRAGTYNVTLFDSDEAIRRLLAGNGVNESPCGKLASADIWRKIPFPEGRVYEDLSIMAKTFGEAERIAVVESKLYGQVYREGSITRKKIDNKQFFDFVFAVRDVDSFVQKHFGTPIKELTIFRVLMCARMLRLANDLTTKTRDCDSVLNEARMYLKNNEISVLTDFSICFSLKAKMVLILHFPSVYQTMYSLSERRKMRA